MFARSAFEWNYGSRKKAYTLCELAMYSMNIGDLKNIQKIEEHVNQILPYCDWKKCIIDIMVNAPSFESAIGVWINQFKVLLKQQLETVNLSPRDGKEIDNIAKIKTRDAKVKDFKEKPIRIFFEKKNKENFTRSSIHGVKGETYDAVLLHVKSQTGSTITPNLLKNGPLYSELMRIAYVGMTRPRRLLIVAMPGTVTKVDYPRFSKKNWEYVVLK